jgi:hypothetical protein
MRRQISPRSTARRVAVVAVLGSSAALARSASAQPEASTAACKDAVAQGSPTLAKSWAELSEQLYKRFKGLEICFPPPAERATLRIGTFDARTGRFEPEALGGAPLHAAGLPRPVRAPAGKGLPDVTPDSSEPEPFEPPTPRARVWALNVTLTFDIKNAQAPVEVVANSVTATAAAGQNTLAVDVGTADGVRWTLRSGTRGYADSLVIEHDALRVGAFIVPAVPYAIMYEPPQPMSDDTSHFNWVSYAREDVVGTSITSAISTGSSKTVPLATGYEDLNAFKATVRKVGSAVKIGATVLDPGSAKDIADGLSSVSSTLDDALGTASASRTDSLVRARSTKVEVTQSTADVRAPNSHLGPGRGDELFFHRGARFAYYVQQGHLTLVPLGAERYGVGRSMRALQADVAELATKPESAVGSLTSLTSMTLQALLQLDPFVSDTNAKLDAPRFAKSTQVLDMEGVDDTLTWTWRTEEIEGEATTSVTTEVRDLKKGFLSFLGPGYAGDIVMEDEHFRLTTVESTSRERTRASARRVTAAFHFAPLRPYAVEGYYDRVFGTYAFRRVPPGETLLGGTVTDASGLAPKAGQRVVLQFGDRTLVTRTDRDGRYTFRAAGTREGPAILIVGGRRVPVTVSRPANLRFPVRLP